MQCNAMQCSMFKLQDGVLLVWLGVVDIAGQSYQ